MIPVEIADLTAEFFTYALERDVECAELVGQNSGTTGRARFRLAGDPALPASVFVKLAPFDERQREFVNAVGMGVAEARFYRDLAYEVPVRVPHAYHSDTDGERYVMLLEDPEAGGCRFPSPKDPDIELRGRDIVEQLAAWPAPNARPKPANSSNPLSCCKNCSPEITLPASARADAESHCATS